MRQKVWGDKRSGALGCLAGNAVLAKLQEAEREKVTHEKGTTFVTPEKVFVGRMCSSDKYLQKGIAHFCNMSMQQHEAVMGMGKEAHYLFITVSGTTVHYWIVPAKIVGSILPQLSPKPDNTTRFLRITEKDGKYFLGDKNVTQYHHELSLSSRVVSRLSRDPVRKPEPRVRERGDGRLEVAFTVKGKQYTGVLDPSARQL